MTFVTVAANVVKAVVIVVVAVVVAEAVVLEYVVVAITVVSAGAEQVNYVDFVVLNFLFLQPMYRHIFVFEETS